MGNCVQSGGAGAGRLVVLQAPPPQRRRRRPGPGPGGEGEEEEEEGAVTAASVVKVKMVLTKGELGWLVSRLNAGDRRLEDVLQEMARKRAGHGGWRPSLESIVECPGEAPQATSSSTSGASDRC